jgi:hypothetical protein
VHCELSNHDRERLVSDEVDETDFGFIYLDVERAPIAWLVYRGIVNSPDIVSANPGGLSWFLLDTIRRGLTATVRREGLLEGVRLNLFSKNLSRLRAIYAFPTLEAAKRADLRRLSENLVGIAPVDLDFRREVYDMRWIDNFDALGADVAARYWTGEAFPTDSLPEVLLSGRFAILGTTVRKRAYDTIKRADPNSLAMLELSRLAAHFGSDLGAISPWLRQDDQGIVIGYIINYREEEGIEVWRRTLETARSDPAFQVNWADLKPLTKPSPEELFRTFDARQFEQEFRVEKATELHDAILSAMAN